MKIKSFFASTMAAALNEARREMGPEAMILESRKAPGESRHLGEYEVVVGLPPEPGAEEAAESGSERFSGELAALRRELESMHRAIARSVVTSPRWAIDSAEMSETFTRLMGAEVEAELAREIVDALGKSTEPPGRALVAELARRIRVNPELGKPGASQRVAALVGPPGSGKTTTLVKLAVACGVAARKPLQLLSVDNFRVAGAEQLRSYATILGAGFQALDTMAALGQALDANRSRHLVLIDTPGYSRREMDSAAELAAFFASRPEIDVHLVVTASMKSADLSRVVEQFSIFRPGNLLFTRLDETESLGTLYSLAARTALPVSFLAAGQRIPEDLQPAAAEDIAGGLVGRAAWASRAA